MRLEEFRGANIMPRLGEKVERFILSTGRSGSTLLTHMVAQNRKVLVLSEFMVAMDPIYRFTPEPVSGAEFSRIMDSTDDIAILVYERSLRISERVKKDGGDRIWGDRNIMPSLAATVLATVSDDPVALFDEAVAFARTLPVQSIGKHYRALFAWLAQQLGREVWIERSGTSMRWFPEIRSLFPDARFLHIHRSGVEAALSMMNHPWFILASQYESHPASRHEMEVAVRSRSREPDDPVGRFYHEPPPVEYFGWNWSHSLLRGYRDFVKIDAGQFTDMRFEDLTTDPRSELRRLSEFFELPDDEGWLDRAAALARPSGPSRAEALSAADLERLESACLPGEVLIGRKDPNLLMETYETIRSVMPRQRFV